jgi:hypothetical protein
MFTIGYYSEIWIKITVVMKEIVLPPFPPYFFKTHLKLFKTHFSLHVASATL